MLQPHLEIITEMIILEPPSGAISSVIIIDNVLEPHLEIITEMTPLEPPSGAKFSVIITNVLEQHLEILTDMTPGATFWSQIFSYNN